MDVNFLDPNYLPWLIPVPPIIAFALIILFVGRSKAVSQFIALAGVFISWMIGWGLFFHSTTFKDFGKVIFSSQVDWMDLGAGDPFTMGVALDGLSAVMLFMVPIAILMIFVYSIGYMNAYPEDDPHQIRNSRFFAYLSLFAAAMLTLVVADNLLLLFMAWEVMGLCSYLLIGFLFEKKSAYQAAVKAFMTTRVADVLFLVAIGYLYAEAGTLNYRDIMYNADLLASLAESSAPILGISAASLIGLFLVFGTIGKAAQFPLHVWLPDAMEGPTPVSAMIHAAAMVSAGVFLVIRMFPLISAGADPHHGVYNTPLIVMGLIGSITALGAGLLGIGQWDIKRVLAYSTISQLGFMIAALGIGAYVAAFFHLITHAFFKALLFMSSGAVIHAMEHGEHIAHDHHAGHGHDDHGHDVHAHHDDHGHHHAPLEGQPYGMLHTYDVAAGDPEWTTDMIPDGIQADFVAFPNDMRNMGGLAQRIPLTALAFTVGGLSLAGFPLITAGFWSKDEIFADALTVGTSNGVYWLHIVVFISLFLAALCTAFYTGRQLILTFLGQPRTDAAKYATLMSGHYVHEDKLDEKGVPAPLRFTSVLFEDDAVDEQLKGKSPLQRFFMVYDNSFAMQLPLMILAFFALTAGFVGIPADFPVLSAITGEANYFKDFIKYSIPTLIPEGNGYILETAVAPKFSIWPVLFSFGAALGGLALAWTVYGRNLMQSAEDKDPMQLALGDTVWAALQNRFYIDALYLRYLVVPFEWFGRRVTYREIDQNTIDELLASVAQTFTMIGEFIKRFNYVVIDGVSDGIPLSIAAFSRWFRNIQSGRAQQYMLFAAISFLVLGLLLILQLT